MIVSSPRDITPALPDLFQERHIGPGPAEMVRMLDVVGVPSLDALIDEIVPGDIRLKSPVKLPAAEMEFAYHRRLRALAACNRVCRSYIGQGYHDTITPAVIQRNVFENPGWYTPYTPYQAEIAQGRLESLLNYQTMVSELCAMEVANASLLDEATAAAEAMALLMRVNRRAGATTFLVSDRVFPQVRDVLIGRAGPLGVTVRFTDVRSAEIGSDVFGVYIQSPDSHGELVDVRSVTEQAHAAGALVAVGSDLLSMALFEPPGEAGADVVSGSAQRFGVPLGFGGPHAAFFATREKFVRQVPGRIIGVSIDSRGRQAYRMALQTREQHIRREKATSNICTAQALLANMAAFYGVYHGPEGLKAIAGRIHDQTTRLATVIKAMGLKQTNRMYFDTVRIEAEPALADLVRRAAETRLINFWYPEPGVIQISLNETVNEHDLDDVVSALAEGAGIRRPAVPPELDETVSSGGRLRTTAFMLHPVFNSHHSETEMMRYVPQSGAQGSRPGLPR